MTQAFLSLGSNIEPEKSIIAAVKLLSKEVRILKISTVYLTESLGGRVQPKFYNCVVKVETDIQPHQLKFGVLRNIERKLGRKRTRDKFAPRTIDMDIVLYGSLQVSEKDLVIPDPEIEERSFLAVPLSELEPGLRLPISGKSIREVADGFRNHGMIRLDGYTDTLRNIVASLAE